MYYSVIGILALLVLLIENYDILLKLSDVYEKPAWRIYRKFMFAVLFYYLTDICWGIFDHFKILGPLMADTTIFFFSMSIGVYFWASYAVAYLEEDTPFGQFLVLFGRTISAGILIFSIVNIFMPVIFLIDEEGIFHSLSGRYLLFVCQIVLLVMLSVYASSPFEQISDVKRKRRRTISSFGLIMATFLSIQLFQPLYPFYTVAYMLGTCVLRTFVINDEREEYRRLGNVVSELKREILGRE